MPETYQHHAGCGCLAEADMPTGRRGFLKLATLGAGVTLFGLPPVARAAGGTDALLLSCMDYRLVDDVVRYMDGRGLTNNYDHVILAGASLGALTDKFASWGKTFWDHLEVAIQLHHIKKVMVMDHRDCGAYKVILGKDLKDDPAAETAAHAEQLKVLAGMIKEKHADLEIELLLMALDGSVEAVA
ncbi:MAG TPA: carbonic anhydrase [Azospirillaceae bacterium]|nr:carbonic anhydrase [Azospirillaceae bacterium]